MNVLFLFLSKSELFDTILSYWELIVVLCFRTVCLCFFSILWAWTYLCFLFFFFFWPSYALFPIPFLSDSPIKHIWWFSLVCSHWQPCGLLSKDVNSIKAFPNFCRDPWARRLNISPENPRLCFPALARSPASPVYSDSPSFPSHTTFQGPGGGSLPWSSRQELSYGKEPWSHRGNLPVLNWLLMSKKIWPLYILY